LPEPAISPRAIPTPALPWGAPRDVLRYNLL
jgi:hypothetical protein